MMNRRSCQLVEAVCSGTTLEGIKWCATSRKVRSSFLRRFPGGTSRRNFFFKKESEKTGETTNFLAKLNLKNFVKKGRNGGGIIYSEDGDRRKENYNCQSLGQKSKEHLENVDTLSEGDVERIDKILAELTRVTKQTNGKGHLLELIGLTSSGENVIQASLVCINTCDSILKKMCKEQNIFKIINMVDTVSNNLCKLGDALELLRNLHTNQGVMAKAHEALEKLTTYIDVINIDEKIYHFLKTKYEEHAHALDREHAEVLLNMIMSMENQGVHIKDRKQRQEYLELQAQEKYISFHATSNVGNEYDGVFIQKRRLLPFIDEEVIHNYEKKIKPFIESGKVKKNNTHENYDSAEWIFLLQDSSFIMTVLENVPDEEVARNAHALLKKPNQTFLKNILVLQYYRNMLTQFRNFRNFSEYSLKNCILNSPEKVHYFLRNFFNTVLPHFFEELRFVERYIDATSSRGERTMTRHLEGGAVYCAGEGTSEKVSGNTLEHHTQWFNGADKHPRSMDGGGRRPKLTPENMFYYMNEIRKEKLKEIEAEMKNRLTLYQVIRFVVKLLKDSYALEMVNVAPLPNELWDESILKFEIRDGSYTYGYLYMDLFERENKNHSIAQYTVRCSKNMNACLKHQWFEESAREFPFFYAGIVRDGMDNNKASGTTHDTPNWPSVGRTHEQAYRQTTSTFLVCNFSTKLSAPDGQGASASAPPQDNLFINEKIAYSLGRIKMSIDKVNMFLHEFGHTLHCILSSTYLQHLSGNRGGVDFSEFTSHFFEEYLNSYDALLQLYGENGKETSHSREKTERMIKSYLDSKNILCYYSIMQVTIQSIIDQIFYCLSDKSSCITERNELIEKKINEYFSGVYYKDIFILDLFPQIHFSKTTHLVHYPANYFCYLYCSVLSKYVWERTFKRDLMNPRKGAELVNFMRGGSVDSSLRNIIALVEGDSEKVQYYTENPQHLPLEDYLKHYSGKNKSEEYNTFLEAL
ncbi:endopeptidase, putative [Plasmodium knowlesi strain H]|uniref:Endopeptidase, putative n=3 Tax=Plasmodium knowlesi TaxID=5850 RepID=A0A5K1U8G1_PLAKH|nr:mitochondrial intermediate peptidase, putative [Plasmodium knowlesi strain H]OTN66481.1 putative Endopeptidase [Plasmodium knowlesi]CAA9989962.1 mitochondrial intermediate peptidase, putative [Plasmodium knowlesi strain H]SBO24545.1 endopeptidase, putative [Plasmodium knowlesi strain H]SBO26370.1 endopeptidase, putative [Plasmodium knowlesi strain H]VVS79436.1 mitochondrial intermediate peptidase, putative [Plasmodium knowlesi strain H]|eukprot:XP_002259977.1 endopeptidase, putative [Plasmodium knowlesi strain H]